MTLTKLAKILMKDTSTVKRAIVRASAYTPSISNKLINGNLDYYNKNFSQKECEVILTEVRATELQKILVKEYFDNLKKIDYYVIEGTQAFVRQCSDGNIPRCCDSCIYISGDKTETKHPVPYCNNYQCLLSRLKMKVYKDSCPYYIRSDCDKPIVWYTDKAPINLDKFGNFIERKKSLSAVRTERPSPLCGFF